MYYGCTIFNIWEHILWNSMEMKTDWYLKLCQITLPEQQDLIEQKWGKELTRLHMNYTYWVVDRENSL